MKRIGLILMAIVLMELPSLAQNVNIPDSYFLAALIEEGVDTNEDGQISYAEAEAIDSLNVSGKNINYMTGIEAFANIIYLNCESTGLNSLDVSSNTSLTELYCKENHLENLDITNNTELRILNCVVNTITSLDISNNIVLEQLNCGVNFLNALDLSNNPALTELNCESTGLNSLDVSNNVALVRLNCYANNLNSLDVSKNRMLEYLNCALNPLSSLDLSNNTSLISLYCIKNELTNLDLSNNTALTSVICHDNQLVSIDVSNITTLTRLNCSTNQLSSLDISTNIYLEGLDCCDNYLDNLDISNNILLGQGEEDWQEIKICNNPTLSEVCVWTMPFPPPNVNIHLQGSPNVEFTMECTIGIEESSASGITIYPNPTYSLFTINLNQTDQYTIEIFSLSGQLSFSTQVEGTAHQIDLTSFQKGIYFITIRSKDFVTTRKIIKL